MTADVENKTATPATKSGMSATEKIVFGIVILAIAALVIYQVFFCPTCYGTSIN